MTIKLKRVLNEIARKDRKIVLKALGSAMNNQEEYSWGPLSPTGTTMQAKFYPDGTIGIPTRLERAQTARDHNF